MVLERIAVGEVVRNRWQVLKAIGEGGFGAVYEVGDTQDHSVKAAMKVESKSAPVSEKVLRMDSHIMERVRDKGDEAGRKHFCAVLMKDETPTFQFVVMTLVGKSFFQLRRLCEGRFSTRTAVHVAINSLDAIRTLHNVDYLHRDIKPGNIAIGIPPQYRQLFLFDFGLCRLYRHEDGRIRKPRLKTDFKGTMRYAAVACHKGEEMARCDDLWSWLYMIVEMIAGALGWQQTMTEVKGLSMQEQVFRVGVVKERLNTKPTLLMQNCPSEFMQIHAHISELTFMSDPDYNLILALLQKVEQRRRQANKDGEALDWEPGGRYGQVLQE